MNDIQRPLKIVVQDNEPLSYLHPKVLGVANPVAPGFFDLHFDEHPAPYYRHILYIINRTVETQYIYENTVSLEIPYHNDGPFRPLLELSLESKLRSFLD